MLVSNFKAFLGLGKSTPDHLEQSKKKRARRIALMQSPKAAKFYAIALAGSVLVDGDEQDAKDCLDLMEIEFHAAFTSNARFETMTDTQIDEEFEALQDCVRYFVDNHAALAAGVQKLLHREYIKVPGTSNR